MEAVEGGRADDDDDDDDELCGEEECPCCTSVGEGGGVSMPAKVCAHQNPLPNGRSGMAAAAAASPSEGCVLFKLTSSHLAGMEPVSPGERRQNRE